MSSPRQRLERDAQRVLHRLGRPEVGAEAEDLIALQFRDFQRSGPHDRAAGAVDRLGELERSLHAATANFAQAEHHVLVRVVVVVLTMTAYCGRNFRFGRVAGFGRASFGSATCGSAGFVSSTTAE